MATIYDVADLAGVSLATVSRVMNKNARVSEKTKQKVTSAMEALDYRPSAIAKGLASNQSSSVGVVISELHGPFYGKMMSAIETELRRADVHAIFAAGHSDPAEEKEAIEFLLSRKCDALVLWVESVPDKYLVELAKRDTPVVILGRKINGLAKNCITVDNQLGGYMAACHLAQKGHKKVAYISGPLWKKDSQDRLKGFQRGLEEHKIKLNEKLIYEGDYQETGGAEGITHLLKQRAKFSAVFCSNDEMAAGAMAAVRDLGIVIPEELSFMGFDNVKYAEYVYPRLSTVNYPVGDMAQMAAKWVLKHVYRKKSIEIVNNFEPSLVSRDSVA